ncbi:unnamed protein product [Adineta ricciae]|uniref:Uncharacterized protein n=1 Tax=Adineta ricciae TaxID=249248 RepID=A0A814WQ37_ADIRI|nr:unnamed protein product [Adineta ricciae]
MTTFCFKDLWSLISFATIIFVEQCRSLALCPTATWQRNAKTVIGFYIAFNGTINIVDHGNNRVTKWPPDAANGTVIAGGYGIGSNVNQLSYPYAVSVSYSSSSIWIADIGTHRIWNICGNGHNQLCYPASVVVDSNGYIYITDSFNSRIMRWMLGSRSWYCCRWKLNVPIANLGSSSSM